MTAIQATQWNALTARIAIFPVVPFSDPPSSINLYKAVWGADPDQFFKQPNPLRPSVAQGVIGGVLANCAVLQSRIDFSLGPAPSNSPDDSDLPTIEDTSQVRKELVKIIDSVKSGIITEPVGRVATVVQFIIVASTFSDANRILVAAMPNQYKITLADEEDFIFQVNRAHRVVDNIRMNFLKKWSVERFQIVNVPISIGPGAPPSPTFNVQPVEILAASVTFDNNNMPQLIPIDHENQALLLNRGLSQVAQDQRDFGMNIAGFEP